MANARQNFIKKLKSEAQKSANNTKNNQKDDNIRDVSPVPRQLSAEECLLLEDILENSDDEYRSPHKNTTFQITEMHLKPKTKPKDFKLGLTESREDFNESCGISNSDKKVPLLEGVETCCPNAISSNIENDSLKPCCNQNHELNSPRQTLETRDVRQDLTENANHQDSVTEYNIVVYDNVLLHSVNPALGVESVPESPALNDSLSKNICYDSPNFSPYITDQLLLLNEGIPENLTQSPSISTSPFRTVQENTSSAQSPLPEHVVQKKRNFRSRLDTGRIRKVYKDKWLDVQRKNNRNAGKEYKSRDGTLRTDRKLGLPCKQTCRLKCNTKFTLTRRQELFKNFWKMGELVRHWEYINKYCDKIPKRRITTETDSKRQYTIRYNLPKEDDRTAKIKVCKTMFLNTFDIKEGLVYSAINKLNAEGTVSKDDRGCHTNRKIIVTDEMKSSVCEHINSFSPIESHYVRSRSSKVYLDGSLSIARMYLLFQEWKDDKNRDKVKTERQYRDILNENFNIGFYIPKKDQCDVCHGYQNTEKPAEKEAYEKHAAHLRNKLIAREMKNKDKENAKTKGTDTIAAVYDFQKVHGLPYGEVSTLYYKRKLTVFNFTIYDLGNNIGTCYVWDETTAKRGAIEVASCVYDFIATHKNQNGIKVFHFYSDNCGGQNRNRIVFAAYMRAARDFQVTITHKYLEKGHTQNEGDSVHALIERSAKNKMIFTPSQWYAMIRWAKQDKKPYVVKEMDNTQFLDFKILLLNCNWTNDTQNHAVPWSKIRQLEILPNNSGCIYFKTDFCAHGFSCIVVENTDKDSSKKKTRRGKSKEQIFNIPMHSRRLGQAYETKLPITKAKKKDLLYLCKHKIIPVLYHSFYENLEDGDVIIDEDDYLTTVLP